MPKLLLIFLLGLAGAGLPAQDAVFSQFYAAPVRLNPALTGIGAAPRLTVNYRSQHTNFPTAYTTLAASYEQPVFKSPSNFGVRLLSDRQLDGAYRNTEFALLYSYDIQFDRKFHARLGLAAGILNTSLDFSRLTFGDVIDQVDGASGRTREVLEARSRTAADFGAGIVIYGGPFYGGVSFEHINRPDENLLGQNEQLYAGRPQRLTLTTGAQINVKRYTNRRRPAYVTPTAIFVGQAQFRQLTLGSYFGYGPVAVGGWYRHAFQNADGFVGAVSFREDIFRIGFSYDSVVSNLRAVPGGLGSTLEVSITIDFADSEVLQKERFKRRYSECFQAFQ